MNKKSKDKNLSINVNKYNSKLIKLCDIFGISTCRFKSIDSELLFLNKDYRNGFLYLPMIAF
ncbi:hypothetical protein B1U23_05825 (plasmid) [Borreliella burgdorferi]|uniref:Uncharacterized protein n=1 Tax=Borreliella burgdorferi (strain ATCC 35210 / DSM 4680 / CIP 102532 / B31) TaxID=224326 RepID=G5IXH6_BORBU|nr:hypothetical protein BB_K0059 [Borreliella burgdorferi B31]ARS30876.1 hypothetical protein B1U23_05825 [Borreliella burgdorferi]ARS32165.1 hypothetical protein B1U22_06155 [Borreliella burgdorferi]ARS32618.1 hypothetical protein B1U21_01860 [Borreliella burgdorferi]PNL87265.1 hypothetical protein A6J35_006435 [Borreliella burgdorferi]